jgi:hypothetical protein
MEDDAHDDDATEERSGCRLLLHAFACNGSWGDAPARRLAQAPGNSAL